MSMSEPWLHLARISAPRGTALLWKNVAKQLMTNSRVHSVVHAAQRSPSGAGRSSDTRVLLVEKHDINRK